MANRGRARRQRLCPVAMLAASLWCFTHTLLAAIVLVSSHLCPRLTRPPETTASSPPTRAASAAAPADAAPAERPGLAWRLRVLLRRWTHHEFWPSWLFYAPLVPWLAWLGLRHRGPLVFLAVNPGIENGGGFIHESKARIMKGLTGPHGCATFLLDALPGDTPESRAARVAVLMREHPDTLGFPIILKPDTGQRGYAVKLARSPQAVRQYLEGVGRPVVVQQYHPGPHECGILWVRRRETIPGFPHGTAATPGPAGFIFAITRKTFPVVTGDGRRTLTGLIHDHPRLACQAATFLARWGAERDRVLAPGERLRLAEAGNHCQGTLFSDGSDLITPALSAVIDDLCARFPLNPDDPQSPPGGLDFGRFDLRYESDDLLRAGRGFGIVELNGSSAEATNLYDPGRSLFWAYGILFRQWSHLFALGAARVRKGWPRAALTDMRAAARAHYGSRDGSAIAD
ncbi:MAG: carboxylate--amine ligase [Phycisphaerales bacterium]